MPSVEAIHYFELRLEQHKRNLEHAKRRGDTKAVEDILKKIRYHEEAISALVK